MNKADRFVADFLSDGWDSQPFERLIDLIDRDRVLLLPLAIRILDRIPAGGTFFHALLSHLSEDEFAHLIAVAASPETKSTLSEAEQSVFAYASLQFPRLLTPYLRFLFHSKPNDSTYYRHYPWRGADAKEIDALIAAIEDPVSIATAYDAWDCLLETRGPRALRIAALYQTRVPAPYRARFLTGATFRDRLRQVDHELLGDEPKRLYTTQCFHMAFPEGYASFSGPVGEMRNRHPTWNRRATPAWEAVVGGTLGERCSLCNGSLHQLLCLPTMPQGLPISLDRISIATCLSCLGWEKAPLYYRHDATGIPTCLNQGDGKASPQFPAEPFERTDVGLVATPGRWFYQDWALSNSRENLSRIGGPPSWIQNAEYPDCTVCSQTMGFILQLDSDSPSGWLWGSGGICYVFWCDPCNISALNWQCT